MMRRVRFYQILKSRKQGISTLSSDPFPNGFDPGNPNALIVYGRRTSRVEKVYYTLEELGKSYIKCEFPSPPPEWYRTVGKCEMFHLC